MNLSDRIRSVMAIDPAAVEIDFRGEAITWGAIAELVAGIDRLLSAAGIGPAAPVGLLLRNRPEMFAAILATIASERCIVCVNPMQGEAKLAADLEALQAPALVATAGDWRSSVVRDAAQRTGSLAIALDRTAEPPAQSVPGLEQRGPGPHRGDAPGVAVEMLTSGTTGPPKRIQLRTDAFAKSLLGASHYESNRSEVPTLQKSFALISGPLVHIGGMFHCVKSAVDGRPVCLLERFDVEAWVDAVRRHRPKVTGLVPSAMKMVMDADVAPEDLSSLRAVTTGTAPLAPELQAAFEERYGIPVLITYGATEFAGAVAGWTIRDHRDFGASKRGSVGRAHPGCALRIVEPESGALLGIDETGLLEVLSEQAPAEGWVRTADRARIDADGFVWIEGRADGAINRGGFKIDPATVARSLERHPAIREAAVVGLPDERLGEVPVAVYELSEGAMQPTEEELLDFAREHLARYFVPTQIRAVDADSTHAVAQAEPARAPGALSRGLISMSRQRLRVGIVGVGWGALVHVPAFRAVEGFEVAAICSRRSERVAAAAERLDIADTSTDWGSFVEREDLDLIAVTPPVTLHREMSLAAIEAGKHLLCEKPLALTAEDARVIRDAAERRRTVAATCFELRWSRERLAIWDWVRSGALGEPYHLRIFQSAGYWHPDHAPQSDWMYRREEGGGYLMGLQSHDIDFALTLLGPPEAIAADVKTTVARRTLADGREIEVDADDTATLLIRFRSGATATLSSQVVGAHTSGARLELVGRDGTLVSDGREIRAGSAKQGDLTALPLSDREPASGVDLGQRRSAAMVRAQALMLEDWLPAFEGGDPARPIPTLRDGWRVQQLIDAARSSSEGAGWVPVASEASGAHG